MKIPNKLILPWRHMLFFSMALAVMMPSVAFNDSYELKPGLITPLVQMSVAMEKDAVAERRAKTCTVWQPCDREGKRREVKRDGAVMLGLLAGLSLRRY